MSSPELSFFAYQEQAPEGWPEPPSPAVLHGLAGDVVRTLAPHTESDPVAILTQFLIAFGNAAGRLPHCMVGSTRHGLNEFMVLVGDTNNGRKGSSWNDVTQLFRGVAPAWFDRHTTGLSTGPGLIDFIRDSNTRPLKRGEQRLPAVLDKRAMIVESELANTLRVMDRKGENLSAVLRQAWDGDRLCVMALTCGQTATDPHVSIVGHITPDELRGEMPRHSSTNGFINRFLVVGARRARLLPRGGGVPANELEAIRSRIRASLNRATEPRLIDMTADAWELWDAQYSRLTSAVKGVPAGIVSRAAPHVRRLAMLYAVSDGRFVVGLSDLKAALALWDYCQRSAAYVFGGKQEPTFGEKLLRAIQAAGPKGIPRTQLWAVIGRNGKASDLDDALHPLLDAGLVETEMDRSGGGRKPEIYRAVKQPAV